MVIPPIVTSVPREVMFAPTLGKDTSSPIFQAFKQLHSCSPDLKPQWELITDTLSYAMGRGLTLPTPSEAQRTQTPAPEPAPITPATNNLVSALDTAPASHSMEHISTLRADVRPIGSMTDLKDFFRTSKYFISPPNFHTLHTSLITGDPLIVEGVPGSGKSTLAEVLTSYLRLDPDNPDHLVRIFCTSDLQKSSFLYEWDDPKRLLHLQYVSSLAGLGHSSEEIEAAVQHLARSAFSSNYLIIHALLKAVLLPYRCVVLLDEVDKTFPEFDTLLLDILETNSFVIPELGRIGQPNKPKSQRPIFILTSNANRDLAAPLRRRASYLNFGFHNEVTETEIFQAQGNLGETDANAVARFLRRIRSEDQLSLSHPPSTAEGLKLIRGLQQQELPFHEDSFFLLHGFWLKTPEDIARFQRIYKSELSDIYSRYS
jgi:MoxR-like ATPase